MSPVELVNGVTNVAGQPTSFKTRPLFWSIRRELWENRSIYIGPLAVAAVVLAGIFIGALRLPDRAFQMIAALAPAKQVEAMSIPYDFAAFAILVTGFIVAVFYSLGALQGERRDRSILFWKSLPVSDLTTVIAKAAIPLVVIPVVSFAIILATLLIIMLASLIILPLRGMPVTMLLSAFPIGSTTLDIVYTLVVLALWHAPIWAWLMLVSGWARRATFLWAFGPPLALSLFEKLAFNSTYVWSLLHYRVTGAIGQAYDLKDGASGMGHLSLQQMDPLKYLMSPGLWLGLAVAAAFFAAAVWQRRYRTPL